MSLYLNDKQEVVGILEIDDYIPVKVRFECNNKRPRKLLYFSVISSDSSFIEFSINSNNKKLVELTVVSINSVKRRKECTMINNLKKGNPDFDLSLFEGKEIITENENFDTIITKDELIILFKNIDEISTCIEMDCIVLLIDKNDQLIGLKFKGFSSDQFRHLNEVIEFSVKNTLDS